MIEIEHLEPFNQGENANFSTAKYRLTIRGKELCRFDHIPADGLGKCLQRAAIAFEESEAERIKEESLVQPRTLSPLVNLLWEGNDCLSVKVYTKGQDSLPNEENHYCGDLEGFLRCLLELKFKGVEVVELNIGSKINTAKKNGARGSWSWNTKDSLKGYFCNKCNTFVPKDKALKCICDKGEVL